MAKISRRSENVNGSMLKAPIKFQNQKFNFKLPNSD